MPPRASVGKPEPPSTTVHQVQDVRRGSPQTSEDLRSPRRNSVRIGAPTHISTNHRCRPRLAARFRKLRHVDKSWALRYAGKRFAPNGRE